MKRKLLLIPSILFLFIIIIFFYLLLSERDPSAVPSALIGKEAPIFKAERLFNEKEFNSSEEFGNEIVIVNFFATWCKPCREEHIFINRLSNEKNIKIIGINFKDDPKKSIRWLKEMGNPYSLVVLDKLGNIAIDWGVYGIPETFIVSSSGVIKFKYVGPLTNKVYKIINQIIINEKKLYIN